MNFASAFVQFIITVCAYFFGCFIGRCIERERWKNRCNDTLTTLQATKQQVPAKATRPFVVIAMSDEFTDYIMDAAHGHSVSESAIRACIEPFILYGRFTLVFDLNGELPRLLPNSEKPTKFK